MTTYVMSKHMNCLPWPFSNSILNSKAFTSLPEHLNRVFGLWPLCVQALESIICSKSVILVVSKKIKQLSLNTTFNLKFLFAVF